jgi:hypothetical protein
MQRPEYAEFWALKWGDLLANSVLVVHDGTAYLQDWLRESFRTNKPYDQFVRELLTATGSSWNSGAVNYFARSPEDLVAVTSQVFLGVGLQCARCHDHPSEKWRRDDFIGFTAFFSQVGSKGRRPPPVEAIIRLGSLGAMGLCLSDFFRLKALAGTSDEGRSCIMILLDGGPPQHETFDMKPDAPSDVRGTFKPIPTNVAGIQICEHLPKTARQVDKFAIIRSATDRTALHFEGVYFLMTGYMPIQSLDFPAMGSVGAKELGPCKGTPPYILSASLDHAMGPGFLGGAYAPFWVRGDPSAPDFRVQDVELPVDMNWSDIADRRWLLQKMDASFRQRDVHGQFETRDRFFQEAENIIR